MRAYIIRRLLITIPTLLIVSMIVFALMRILPGDIVTVMIRVPHRELKWGSPNERRTIQGTGLKKAYTLPTD